MGFFAHDLLSMDTKNAKSTVTECRPKRWSRQRQKSCLCPFSDDVTLSEVGTGARLWEQRIRDNPG